MRSRSNFVSGNSESDLQMMNALLSADKIAAIRNGFLQRKEPSDTQLAVVSMANAFTVLQENEFLISDLKKFEIQQFLGNPAFIEYRELQKVIIMLLKEQKGETHRTNNDFLDAFVALGGNNDSTGSILISSLFDALKEFGVSIDNMSELEKGLTHIDYDHFAHIFESNMIDDVKTVCSYLSSRSNAPTNAKQTHRPGFERNLNDFHVFLEQHPTFFAQ